MEWEMEEDTNAKGQQDYFASDLETRSTTNSNADEMEIVWDY